MVRVRSTAHYFVFIITVSPTAFSRMAIVFLVSPGGSSVPGETAVKYGVQEWLFPGRAPKGSLCWWWLLKKGAAEGLWVFRHLCLLRVNRGIFLKNGGKLEGFQGLKFPYSISHPIGLKMPLSISLSVHNVLQCLQRPEEGVGQELQKAVCCHVDAGN